MGKFLRLRITTLIRFVGLFLILSACMTLYIQNTTDRIETFVIDEELLPWPNESNSIRVFNFSRLLKPKSLYNSIICRKSAHNYVRTMLCPHEIRNDVHVSSAILIDGVWEPHVLTPFLEYANAHSDWLVIDIGAQIGQFSLFAGKLGRDVVAIEPFFDNIVRFHKAVVAENLQNRIRLITNAISDERGQIQWLQKMEDNIGGQYVIRQKNSSDSKAQHLTRSDRAKNKYLVETIWLDDIIAYLPKMANNQPYLKAMMKIDIEGYEPYALSHSAKLFANLDIRVIFMEWGQIVLKEKGNRAAIDKMLDFLMLSYNPMADNMILSREEWRKWPWDIMWIKI